MGRLLAALPDQAALLQALFAFSPLGLQIYEADGRCLLVNRVFEERLGVPPAEHNVFLDENAHASGLVEVLRRGFLGERAEVALPDKALSFAQDHAPSGAWVSAIPLHDTARNVSHVVLSWAFTVFATRTSREGSGDSAMEWMARLQRVTSRLSEALTADAVGEVVVREAALGTAADVVFLYVTSPSSGRLELLAQAGLDDSSAEEIRKLDLASGSPCTDVVTLRQPIFAETREHPLFDCVRSVRGLTRLCALAAVPMLVGQRAVGSLCIGFYQSHTFGPEERSYIGTLGRQSAQALDRARLYEAEKRARRLSQKNEELYQLIARATKEVFWDWDVEGGTVTWSEDLERVFGYANEPGRSRDDWWLRQVHPDDIGGVLASIRAVFSGTTAVWAAEYRVKRADGTYAPVIDRGYVTRGQDGRPSRVVGAVLDVTEQKRIEEQVREEARINETLYRIATSLSAELDLSKLVQLMTDEARTLLGAEVGVFFYQVLGQGGEMETRHVQSGMPLALATEVMPTLARRFGAAGPEMAVRRDNIAAEDDEARRAYALGSPAGNIRSYLAVPVISRSGETLGGLFFGHSQPSVFTSRDERLVSGIAGQAAVSMDNAKLFRQAQQAIEVRDHFVSIASHELNTPLTSLVLQLAILRRGAKTPEQMTEKLDMMSRQVARLSKLVSELLDVSRITTGRLRLELETTNLGTLVRDAASRLADDFAKSGSTFEVRVTGELSGSWDRLRMDQVVTNLLSNAIKFGRGRPISVIATGTPGHARIVVTDEGIGIHEEHQQRIFQRFERAVSEQNYGGFGLGLWIVRQIVEAHGGTIDVESRPGEGSTFTVDLPRKTSVARP